MDETKEIIKERLDKLPATLREFINSEGWRANVTKIGVQFKFNEEKQAALENEVFLVLICLEPISDFVANLKTGIVIDENTARTISNYINGAVFGGVTKDIRSMWAEEEIPKPEIKERKDNIGESFEQAIVNQAKAMQPARPAMPPNNLPVGSSGGVAKTSPTITQPINPGPDPYREPVE